MTDKLLEIFLDEAQELVADLEKALLKLEGDLNNAEGIGTIFRAMHTLKGSAGMFGFDGVNNITHHLESIFQDIRDGSRHMDMAVLATTFKTLDHLRNLMLDPKLENTEVRNKHEELLAEIAALHANESINQVSSAVGGSLEKVSSEVVSTYYIYILPGTQILRNGTNPFYLIEDLLGLGSGLVLPFFKELPTLKDIAPDNSYMGFEVVLNTSKPQSDIQEVFMFVEGDCELIIEKIADTDLLKDQLTSEQLWKNNNLSSPIGLEVIISVVNQAQGKAAVKSDLQKSQNGKATSIRVDSDRLDDLMNLVSELVTTQARLSLYSTENTSGELAIISESVEKITRRLRDNAFSMSLVPLENLVVRFQRLVRDLSKDLNKEIQFKAEGTDTEIDKSIIEKLTDPLLHLLRNSIDHGIETTADRLKKGKSAQGMVLLKSYYSGANVIIEISDDGAGIDTARVRAKAISKGIIEEDTQLSDKEIIDLIFLPGFSTASQVTGVSGRGVGMDVVKRNISDLRGEIEVSTVLHKGTTFIIKLPLTLSIVDGLLVKVGTTDFVLPLGSVAKCYEVETVALESTFNQWTTLEGARTPFLFLRRDFGITENKPVLSQIIKVPYNNSHVGIAVDKIEGEYQAVLRPLGHLYHGQDEFSGATILGDGSVALVLDPNKLIKKLTAANS